MHSPSRNSSARFVLIICEKWKLGGGGKGCLFWKAKGGGNLLGGFASCVFGLIVNGKIIICLHFYLSISELTFSQEKQRKEEKEEIENYCISHQLFFH